MHTDATTPQQWAHINMNTAITMKMFCKMYIVDVVLSS